jgi:TetR/AcrR family transcriptional regulator, cholesterol catabolism regulator
MLIEQTGTARTRILDAAEALFSELGYKSVTLRDVARAVGIRQASLYHHFPEGKEKLFVEVTERALERHREGLTNAIRSSPEDLEAQLQAIARWLLDQPPVDLARMVRSDMIEISEEDRRRLTMSALRSLVVPIEEVFGAGIERESLNRVHHNRLLASSFLAIVEAIQVSTRFAQRPAHFMADEMIGILLNGLRPREAM